MTPAVPPTVAVVIVTFNSRTEIGACLDGIAASLAPLSASITVVDNQSTDATAAFVRERWPNVQVIDAGGNLGFARANNMGVRQTTSDIIVFLNPDTVTPPAALAALVQGLWSRPDAAIAGPRLVDRNGQPELSWGPPIGPWGEFVQKLTGSMYGRRVGPVVQRVERLSRLDREVAWVSGACLAVRRRDLPTADAFDERYFMYTEDVDLCVTMTARGRRVLFLANAEVVHARGRSAARNPATERLRRRSHLAYYEKHHPGWAPVLRAFLRLTGRQII